MASRWFPGVRQLPSTLLLALALSAPSSVYADGHEGKSAADYFVHSLPGAPDGPLVKMHAGHVEITPEHNGNLFFWHFANAHIAERQRTVIWLNGGPGCSSEDGALMEIGPYRLKDDHTLKYNNGSWHEFANLLFVDNPVGTGYSYVNTDSYVHDLEEMATQFIAFLEKWYAIFPEYEHDDIYIAGESYAGQHIPYIAKAILERNKKPDNPHGPWNLKGLLIGNGWISPPEQYDSYIKFAYEKGLIQKGSQTAADLEAQYRICTKELAVSPDKVDLSSCERVLTEMLDKTVVTNPETHKTECYNMYDVRLRDTHPSCGMNWPPDLASVTPYLRLQEVTKALHVSPGKSTGWTECSGGVGQAFRAKKSIPSIRLLPDLLKEVPILLFSGAEDLICNHIGTEALISNMQWNGGKGFEVSPGNWAPRRDWIFEGENAGFWQEARNLTYVLFNNASHMVPFDWPRRSRDMLDRFIGVDVTKLGRLPTESTLDGAAGPTTGNGTTQSAVDVGEAKSQIEKAKWDAYRRSGEIVLVIVAVAAVSWGIFVWRERKKRAGPDYQALSTGDTGDGRHGRRGANGNGALENFRQKRNGNGRDLEAGDFDESELDDLHVESAGPNERRYSIGGDSDAGEDSKNEKKPANPKGSRSLT